MTSLLLADLPLFGANDRGIIIFGFEIYYYAICIVTGIVLATCLSALLMKRRNMSPDFIFTLFVFCIPAALICTRLFYCFTKPLPISQWFNWESIRNGGLSVIGGVIGGVGTGLIVCLVKKVNFFRAADCVVVTILVAQAIGRWGNFFNREVYGLEITDPSQQWFPWAVEVGGRYYHAFFFYESVINLIGFALLFTAAWKWTKKPNGVLSCAYFVWYGIVRSVMEPLRNQGDILQGGGIYWSQLFSILMIVGGVVGIGTLLILNYRKEGSLFGSKRGDPCGITEYLTPYKDDPPYFSKINILGANYPERPPKEPDPRTLREKASDGWQKFRRKFGKKDAAEQSDETQAQNDKPDDRESEMNGEPEQTAPAGEPEEKETPGEKEKK